MFDSKKKFDWKSYIKLNLKAGWYAGIVLASFLILVIIFSVDWRAVLGLRAADTCPVVLGTASLGKITVTGNVTLNASDYANGVIDCGSTDIEVSTGATITFNGYDNADSNWDNDFGITWKVKTLDVKTGATLNLNGTGYAKNRGTGLGGNGIGASAGGGGGYGGSGGQGEPDLTNPAGDGGDAYGSELSPAYMGSGGGDSGTGGLGGAGGGFLRIKTVVEGSEEISPTGTVVINGSITANGTASTAVSGSSGGGGSGGTVFIEAGSLSGSGMVSANGGDAFDTDKAGGGGGGGRIVMLCTGSSRGGGFMGTVTSAGGTGGIQDGQNGSIIGPTCYPESPSNFVQSAYEPVGYSYQYFDLNVGESTKSTQLRFRFSMSDVDDTDTLYPQIEIKPVGTAFEGVPTKTGSGYSYSGTPVIGEIVVTGLTISKEYHWQARVKDEAGAVSDWVSYTGGIEGQGEGSPDFVVSGNPVSLLTVSGNNQSGSVSTQLSEPFVVKVVDSAGLGVPFKTIGWSVVSGGGSLSVTSVNSDRFGRAESYLTLGTKSGTNNNSVNATGRGLSGSPQLFIASAVTDMVDHYEIIGPTSVITGNDFELTINARDQYNNLVTAANGDITLSAVLASDSVTPASGTFCIGICDSPEIVTLVSGTVTIENANHSLQESIKIKGVDNNSKQGLSNTIAVMDSYGTCPDADGIIDVSTTWTATTANAGIFDCTGMNLSITNGAVLTLASYSSGLDGIGATILTDNLNINTGAKISGDGQGFAEKSGPGYNKMGSSHGGLGFGYMYYTETPNTATGYGNVIAPTTLGSGGYDVGVSGGGAIKLMVSGTTTINGQITSNGENAITNGGRGGASGGSIWLVTHEIAGNGLFSANGGNGDSPSPNSAGPKGTAGGGSGGRISIIYDINNGSSPFIFNSEHITAYGGGNNDSHTAYGGPGTIYIENTSIDTENEGKLLIANNNLDCVDLYGRDCDKSAIIVSGAYNFNEIELNKRGNVEILGCDSSFTVSDASVFAGDASSKLIVGGNFIFGGGATLSVNKIDLGFKGQITNVSNLNIGNISAGKVSLYAENCSNGGVYDFVNVDVQTLGQLNFVGYYNSNSDWDDDYGVTLNAENLSVYGNGILNADGFGFFAEKGPGAGAYDDGSSHGGYGELFGKSGYGNVYYPTSLGSGGADRNLGHFEDGGFGGGAITLNIKNRTDTGHLYVEGSITADGTSGRGGGGTGGSILIDADIIELKITSSITAVGGAGNIGADGGGGRIAIHYLSNVGFDFNTANIKVKMNVSGGDYGSDSITSSGAGTIYIEDKSTVDQYEGDIYVDNKSRTIQSGLDTFSEARLLQHSAYAVLPEGNYNFRKIYLLSNGNLRIEGASSTLYLESSNVFDGDSTKPLLLTQGNVIFSGGDTININGLNWGIAGDVTGVTNINIANISAGAVTLYSDSTAYGPNGSGKKTYYEFGNISIFNGGYLYFDSYEDGDLDNSKDSSDDFGIPLKVENLTIDSGGMVSSNGLGYGKVRSSEDGPGYSYEKGSVYGGFGEDNDIEPFGSVYVPKMLGTKGGDCGSAGLREMKGGAGGGVINIEVSGNLTLNGTISSNGIAGYTIGIIGCSAVGGGTGGSILIKANNLSGTGVITANGYQSDKDGSGGRIALYYVSNSNFTFDYNHLQSRGIASGPGTVYVEQLTSWGANPQFNGSLYVDNASSNTLSAGVIEGNYSFSKVNVTRYGHLIFLGQSSVVAIDSGTGFQGDSTIPDIRIDGTLTYTGDGDLNIEGSDIGINGDIVGVEGMNIGLSSPAAVTLYANTWAKHRGDEYVFDSVHIGSQGDLNAISYNSGDTDWTNDFGVNLVLNNLTIDSGGSLNADSTGYGWNLPENTIYGGPGEGLNEGGVWRLNSAGGSYGGYGYEYIDGSDLSLDTIPIVYGDVYYPEDLGSKGGSCSSYAGYDIGGAGGGAIHLEVSNELIIEGQVSSNGGNSIDLGGVCTAGSGSGGSLYIKVKNLISNTGNGIITANGGTAGNDGSGGRISLYYENSQGFLIDSDHLQARGTNAGPGTVYVENFVYGEDPSLNGSLYVDNNYVNGLTSGLIGGVDYTFSTINLTRYGKLTVFGPTGSVVLTSSDSLIGDSTVPSLEIQNNLIFHGGAMNLDGVHLKLNGSYEGLYDVFVGGSNAASLSLYAKTYSIDYGDIQSFGDFTISSKGSVFLNSYETADNDSSNDFGPVLSFENLTIENGGYIDASGMGYGITSTGWEGPGGALINTSKGGTYGGHGENASNIDTYGDIFEPNNLGSRGSSCTGTGSSYVGGAGGGVVNLTVKDRLLLNGEIRSNGVAGYKIGALVCNWGGGSGGSVLIRTGSISGSGYVKANGYDGLPQYFEGGAGRVALYYSENEGFNLDSTHIQAYGYEGGPGSVFIKDVDEEYGSLLISNGGISGNYGPDIPAGSYDFKYVNIDNGVKFKILGSTEDYPKGVSLNVQNNFYLGEGSLIDGSGQGFAPGEGDGAGSNGSIDNGGDGSGGGGGAHGGDGGLGQDDGVNGTTTGGKSYGSPIEPLTLGSGGGFSGAGASGGYGGGALAIYSTNGSISIYGEINVDGTDGLISSPGGGGGAGGSILLKAQNIVLGVGSVLSAIGGNGGDEIFDGGGGGGGRISISFGESYIANGSLNNYGGLGYQTGQVGTTFGPLGYPQDPENMDQKKPTFETIPVGGTTSSTSVYLEFTVSDADSSDTLTPVVEIRPVGEDFTNIANVTGESIEYNGIPIDAQVSVSGLILGASYHWQARVLDASGVYSDWIPFGANGESEADFTVTKATKLVLETSVSTVSEGGYVTVTVSARDDNDIVDTSYNETVHFTSTDGDAVLPSDYTFAAGDLGVHEFINGVQMMNTGVQSITVVDLSDSDLTDTATINVLPGGEVDYDDSSITVAPSMIENDGLESSLITVTIVDVWGNPLIGKIVSLAASGSGNTLLQPTYATNEEGKTTGSISSVVVGDKVISASVDGMNLNQTATLQVRDTTPPIISNIEVTNITTSSAKISWDTNEQATGQLEYGTTTNYGNATDYDNDLKTEHSIILTGLNSDTTYNFRILARDLYLNEALSSNSSFTTLRIGGETPSPLCGNNVLDSGEDCDDGNLIDGDGCSSYCEEEDETSTEYCTIYNVEHTRASDSAPLNISWNTTCVNMVCAVDYGETTSYGEVIENINPISGKSYEQDIDLSGLDDTEIHYRITCDSAITRDYLYLKPSHLPLTGDEEPTILKYIALYGIPILTGLGLLAQFLNLLAKLGHNLLAKLGHIPNMSQLFGAIFDREKRKKGMGVVYDMDKNIPIPFAVVRLYKEDGVLQEETVTDLDGRYQFIINEGRYSLGVSHPDYVIPRSKDDFIKNYDITGKYLGGILDMKTATNISYDIPMISKGIVDKKDFYHNSKEKFKIFMDKIGLWINIIGGILLILSIIITPSVQSITLAVINVLVLIAVVLMKRFLSSNWGIVFNISNLAKIPGVFVHLFNAKDSKLLNTVISDEKGKYGFIVEEGNYVITVTADGYKLEKEIPISVKKEGKIVKKNIGLIQTGEKLKKKDTDTPFGLD